MYSLISILILALDIYAIYLVLTSGGSTGFKLLWILLILFLPILGMILYFLLGRPTMRNA
jgi:hypothetical protein